MNSRTPCGRTAQLVDAARRLTESTVPVLLLHPWAKQPLCHPTCPHPKDGEHTLWTAADPWEVEGVISGAVRRRGPVNLGALLSPKDGSPVVVDVDDPAAAGSILRKLDVSSADSVWIARTPRGGIHVYYLAPDDSLPRVVNAAALKVDLLTNGYALVPPSRTAQGVYRWVAGHSPADIPLGELPPPPAELLAWWAQAAARPQAPAPEVARGRRLPLGKAALAFVAHGAPMGEQRLRAVAAARNYLSAGYSVEETAAAVWRGLQACEQDPSDPWTYDHALAIARDLASRTAPPLREARPKRGPVVVRFRDEVVP